MAGEPVNLDDALASIDQVYDPRVVATVNDYAAKIAKVRGDHVWHSHADTDEFVLALDGTFDIALRDGPGGAERTVRLQRGDVFVVPRGVEHCPSSDGGAILMFEPADTNSTGDYEGDLPDHVTSSSGRALDES